ncbi:hypothetical protein EH30_00090 [Erythrobacter sp. JL475]|nr:hypothetical protein EH30_00090 [Erythrobacter sp. JL475]
MKTIKRFGAVLVIASGLSACEQLVDAQMDDIYDQVSGDAVKQYEIAKRQGDPIQICVQAGLVSAAYLQAQDEPNYQKWKAIQSADCATAGIPQ